MTYVVIYVDVQPSFSNEAITLLKQYREQNSAEEGQSWTHVLQEISRPNRFVIVEAWKDESFVQAHEQTAHSLQFLSRLNAIYNSPCDRRVHLDFAVGTASATAGADGLHVVTHVDVPPPRKDETEILLKSLAEQSRHDEGNFRYDIFQQHPPRTNHFTVFAVWSADSAFASHETKPHTRKFRELLGPMLGAPYDERLYLRLR
jgi:quinol monooxygenase YgiN